MDNLGVRREQTDEYLHSIFQLLRTGCYRFTMFAVLFEFSLPASFPIYDVLIIRGVEEEREALGDLGGPVCAGARFRKTLPGNAFWPAVEKFPMNVRIILFEEVESLDCLVTARIPFLIVPDLVRIELKGKTYLLYAKVGLD